MNGQLIIHQSDSGQHAELHGVTEQIVHIKWQQQFVNEV